jgi:general secretion pathway protein N
MPMLRGLLYAVVVAASVGATTLAMAPAQWAASAVAQATGDRVMLAEARGSLWRGQASIVLSPGQDAGIARIGLPEALSWQLSPWHLLAGVIDVKLAHPSALMQPLQIRAGLRGGVQVTATTVRLPAAVLAGLGAPFNTIKPGGVISLAWQRLDFEGGRMKGDVLGEWQFASSALSSVAPFGNYRLLAEGGFPGTRLTLSTLSGPLELTGDGTIDEQGQLRFTGRARAQPGVDAATRAQLAGLVLLLGRRDGESAILSLGN